MVKQGNWFKRHPIWTGIIGIFLLLILIGIFVPNNQPSTDGIQNNAVDNKNQNNIDNTKINSEADYLEFLSTQTNRITLILNGASSTSTKASYGDISFDQASDLFKTYKTEFEKVRTNLVNYEPPEKYKDIHTRYIKAINLFIEAMDLASQGASQNNADLINQGAQKLTEASTEISTMTELIKVTT